jgi:hypothetical protein
MAREKVEHTIESMPRDSQRQRTYNAEAETFGGSSFRTAVGLERLILLGEEVCATAWWREVSAGTLTPRVVASAASAKRSRSVYDANEIRVARGMDSVSTLCHELAHFTAPGGHTPAFRAAQVEILRMLSDDGIAACLAGTYRLFGLSLGEIKGAAMQLVRGVL